MDKSLFMKTGALFCLGASILLISQNDLLDKFEHSEIIQTIQTFMNPKETPSIPAISQEMPVAPTQGLPVAPIQGVPVAPIQGVPFAPTQGLPVPIPQVQQEPNPAEKTKV